MEVLLAKSLKDIRRQLHNEGLDAYPAVQALLDLASVATVREEVVRHNNT